MQPTRLQALATTAINHAKRLHSRDRGCYSCYVFKGAHSPRAWTMWTSFPCVQKEEMEELKRMLQGASTAAKAAYSVELSRGSDGSAAKYTWTDSIFGGAALWPRAERSLLVAQGATWT
ncbi:hypothetical protein V8E36_002018 [Tilletia maclaganii]